MQVKLEKSTKSDKKFMVTFIKSEKSGSGKRNKTIHFGAKGYSDYTIHKDKERMKRYTDRHKGKEKWNKSGMYSAGFWAKHILWNKPSLRASINDTSRKFKIKIVFRSGSKSTKKSKNSKKRSIKRSTKRKSRKK
jgi:hypothetical protein